MTVCSFSAWEPVLASEPRGATTRSLPWGDGRTRPSSLHTSDIYTLHFSPFLAHLRERETVFNGNALLHISCKLLLGWPWLMPLVSPLFPQCCPQPPDALSQLLCPVLSTVAGASQPSLGTALPLSLIGESLTRLGPLSRSCVFPVTTLTDVPRRDSYTGISSAFILSSQISQTQAMILPQTQGV